MEGRLRLIVVAIVWVATLFAILAWVLSTREVRLSIAAGPRSGESFQLASAIAQVFNETVPNASIDVFETSGSAENARLLESGQVDVATMQADTHVHGGINALASLYFDAYQLIVTESSEDNGISFNVGILRWATKVPLLLSRSEITKPFFLF